MGDVDTSRLLPADLRAEWLVVQKAELRRTLLVVSAFAAALAISVAGAILGSDAMLVAAPATWLALRIATAWIPWPHEGAEPALRRDHPEVVDPDAVKRRDRVSVATVRGAAAKCVVVVALAAWSLGDAVVRGRASTAFVVVLGAFGFMEGNELVALARRRGWLRIAWTTGIASIACLAAIVVRVVFGAPL